MREGTSKIRRGAQQTIRSNDLPIGIGACSIGNSVRVVHVPQVGQAGRCNERLAAEPERITTWFGWVAVPVGASALTCAKGAMHHVLPSAVQRGDKAEDQGRQREHDAQRFGRIEFGVRIGVSFVHRIPGCRFGGRGLRPVMALNRCARPAHGAIRGAPPMSCVRLLARASPPLRRRQSAA